MINSQTYREPDKGLSDIPVYFTEPNSDMVEHTFANHESTNLDRETTASLAPATPVTTQQATTHTFVKATPNLPRNSLKKIQVAKASQV